MSNEQTEHEDARERVNRELIELLNELRVALPGVQVLFAFLLALPFSSGFVKTTSFQRDLFFATLLCTALSSALLIAPSAYHRLHFRQHSKEDLLRTSNRLSIAGVAFLAAAIVGSIVLISDVLFGTAAAIVFGTGTAIVFGWFWGALPLLRR
jgi:hypothetical protein